MIEFHAEKGPVSQGVGIALEEMFFDYRVTSAALAPAIVEGQVRIEGMEAILFFLADSSGRFHPENRREAAHWIGLAAGNAVGAAALEERLAASPYLLGDISIADMAVYPLISRLPPAALERDTTHWVRRMSQRSATGRGMGAVLP